MGIREKVFIGRLIAQRTRGEYRSFYVNIPKDLVEALGLRAGDVFKIEVLGEDTLLLRRLKP